MVPGILRSAGNLPLFLTAGHLDLRRDSPSRLLIARQLLSPVELEQLFVPKHEQDYLEHIAAGCMSVVQHARYVDELAIQDRIRSEIRLSEKDLKIRL